VNNVSLGLPIAPEDEHVAHQMLRTIISHYPESVAMGIACYNEMALTGKIPLPNKHLQLEDLNITNMFSYVELTVMLEITNGIDMIEFFSTPYYVIRDLLSPIGRDVQLSDLQAALNSENIYQNRWVSNISNIYAAAQLVNGIDNGLANDIGVESAVFRVLTNDEKTLTRTQLETVRKFYGDRYDYLFVGMKDMTSDLYWEFFEHMHMPFDSLFRPYWSPSLINELLSSEQTTASTKMKWIWELCDAEDDVPMELISIPYFYYYTIISFLNKMLLNYEDPVDAKSLQNFLTLYPQTEEQLTSLQEAMSEKLFEAWMNSAKREELIDDYMDEHRRENDNDDNDDNEDNDQLYQEAADHVDEDIDVFAEMEMSEIKEVLEETRITAVVRYSNGRTEWWENGQRHRLGGPAVTEADGSEEWWENGLRHRLGGPAVTEADGSEEWWENGLRHRLGGPAVIEADDSEEWWENGQQHRLNGPAVNNVLGYEEWWVNGQQHRLDGPAIIAVDGSKEWWLNGNRHRLDGPAIINADGSEEWWVVNGQRHRLDGPAIVNASSKQWWQNGDLHRLDGPAIVNTDGSEEWLVNGQRHRLDGPAVIRADGSKEWWQDDQRHRLDGPAVITANKTEFYLFGDRVLLREGQTLLTHPRYRLEQFMLGLNHYYDEESIIPLFTEFNDYLTGEEIEPGQWYVRCYENRRHVYLWENRPNVLCRCGRSMDFHIYEQLRRSARLRRS
jgi:hypothetical protein